MNRLQSELQRLYLPRSPAHAEADTQPSPLIDPQGMVRAMVMELARPASWELLSRVWQGVQAELELPAPAIAVSGVDGLQLWFSLEEPVAASQAQAFLESLRVRFLPDVDARRVRLMPASDTSALRPERHARLVPALQEQTGNWSAFVAADLAPIFADTPWLDIAPNEEGQATLLRGLNMIKPAVLEEALKRLAPSVDAPAAPPRPVPVAAADADPKRFLVRVMNDDTVALALRIEAAKALLQRSG
ncbi:MAG: hypothetical protein Q8R33_22410 [Burkholderiales bacterium]|nr:hypothetical protein [Burkholderiales bacterium]